MPVTKRSAQMAPRGKFENRANASGDSQTASIARRTRTHAGAQANSISLSLFKSSLHHARYPRHHQCAARLDRQRNDGSRDAQRATRVGSKHLPIPKTPPPFPTRPDRVGPSRMIGPDTGRIPRSARLPFPKRHSPAIHLAGDLRRAIVISLGCHRCETAVKLPHNGTMPAVNFGRQTKNWEN